MRKNKLHIIKLGGEIINNEELLSSALQALKNLSGPRILVHGGGRKADQVLNDMGISPRMEGGRRITDLKTLEVVVMVYGGLINKSIVAQLQKIGINACGMTGADMNLIEAVKRPVGEIDFGYAGDIKQVNAESLVPLLDSIVPVVGPLTHDGMGQLLNTNADTIAASLAAALSERFEVHLIYGFTKKGLLKSQNDENEIFEKISQSEFVKGKSNGTFAEGILPKLENAFSSLENGVHSVVICHALAIGNYGSAKFEGTLIR